MGAVSADISDVPGPLADSKRAGERSETDVVRIVPELRLVPDDVAEWYDAVVVEPVAAAGDLRFRGLRLLEAGTPVEIKSALIRHADGQRGRWYLRRGQHERLLEAGGVYCFAVATPDDRRVVAIRLVPATLVEDRLGAWSWVDAGVGRQDSARITWTHVFDSREVET